MPRASRDDRPFTRTIAGTPVETAPIDVGSGRRRGPRSHDQDRPGDGRDVRVAPLLVPRRRESALEEAAERPLARLVRDAGMPARAGTPSNAATSASCRSATAATSARRLLDPAVALGFQLERELLAAGPDDPAVRQHVHEVRHDVVQQPLVVGHDDDRRGRDGGARSRRAATIFSASMSRPESVSSRMASVGSSTAIWKISLRFFSPPEKPSLTGATEHRRIELEQLAPSRARAA